MALNKILFIENDSQLAAGLMQILSAFWHVDLIQDSKELANYYVKNGPVLAAVMVDAGLPNSECLRAINRLRLLNQDLPIIAYADDRGKLNVCEQLVSEYVNLDVNARYLIRKVSDMVELFRYRTAYKKQFQSDLNIRIIDVLSNVIEFRCMDLRMHIPRIKQFTYVLAKQFAADYSEYCLTDADIDLISCAASLHDVGMITVPETILLKPNKLTKEEYDIVKDHVNKGCEIINGISDGQNSPFLSYCYEIVRCHHERYDGTGYPRQLAGDQIPISAQIVGIVDTFEALTGNRVYRKPRTKEEAFAMVLNDECGTFNPDIKKSFSKCKEKVFSIMEHYTKIVAQNIRDQVAAKMVGGVSK